MTTAGLRVSRRRFLAGALAAGSGLVIPRRLRADPPAADANRFALLSDIHISADRRRIARGVNLVEHFLRARGEILALHPRPAAVFVCGDCAFNEGVPGDYALLRELVEPLRQAGLPPRLVMGNHDRRQNLWQAFPECRPRDPTLPPDKHVTVVESSHATWFLLDSMDQPGSAGGRLGETQLRWLAKALDARPGKPALVMAHHNPERHGWLAGGGGLIDTDALFDVLLPRKQVKAYFFGHSHRWALSRLERLHLVNLPTTAYVFDSKQPCGWVDAWLRQDGITLRLNALDRQHPAHGKSVDLAWRSTGSLRRAGSVHFRPIQM
jgi:3',5'-cyclic AMP phosphodiesterase CpdA